jgi:hypothetical protein
MDGLGAYGKHTQRRSPPAGPKVMAAPGNRESTERPIRAQRILHLT